MGTQPETTNYDPTVAEYELTDPVKGGPGGTANAPILALADRTNWLKAQEGNLLAYVTANVRTRLTTNLSLYVNPTAGKDTNPGSPQLPLATLQAAWNLIANSYDLNGFNVTVNMAFGTYAGVNCNSVVGQGSVAFVGSVENQGSVTISAPGGNGVSVGPGCNVSVSGVTITATGTSGSYVVAGFGIVVDAGGNCNFGNVTFGACQGGHMLSFGTISSGGKPYTITGSAPSHAQASQAGSVVIVGSTVSLPNNAPSFSTAFAVANLGGSVQAYSAVFNGTGSGPRFNASTNGVILVQGAGATFLPGSTAGTTNSGGQYA